MEYFRVSAEGRSRRGAIGTLSVIGHEGSEEVTSAFDRVVLLWLAAKRRRIKLLSLATHERLISLNDCQLSNPKPQGNRVFWARKTRNSGQRRNATGRVKRD